MDERKVKRIYHPPAVPASDLFKSGKQRRVAAYARVSTASDEQLKAANVEVFFEKENIYTLDSKGELLITIMSSLAQEESRSISENVTWGQRKRFSDGKVSMPYRNFLGYRKGPDGLPEIDPEQAEIVRRIYRMFMSGKTLGHIARQLEDDGVPTPGGKTKWQSRVLESILTNEKYKGSALLQKTYTVDFLTKTKKVNEGEVPQYYVECSHPAIIDPFEWEAVQVEVARRKKLGRRHDCFTPFSGKVICGDCGGVYGSKIWHSNSKYRRVIWQCNRKFKNETKCTTPHVDEEILKERFLQAVSEYMADPEERIEGLRSVQRTVSCTDFIDADIEGKEAELELLSGMIRNCVMMNASASLTEQEYQAQYAELSQWYESTKAGYKALLDRRKQMEATTITFSGILFRLAELPHKRGFFRAKERPNGV